VDVLFLMYVAPVHKRLVAYLLAQDENAALSATSLRTSLKEKLPEYMIPTSFVELEKMPLTASGKLDRQRLAAVGAERLGPDSKFVAPSKPTEELLCGLWAEVLKVERVGIDDNFFELGGHSLLATQVVSRVRETFGVELLLRSLFEAPSVRGLAAVVDESLRGGANAASGRIERAERSAELPLSFAQQRLWFLDQLEPGNPFYSVPSAVRLMGRLDVGGLERAFSEVVRRHEVLRTSFPQVNGAPVQRIEEWKPLTLPLIDLRGLVAAERENAARRGMIVEAGKPFDLSTGPLLRLCLFQLDDAEHLVLTIMHHIVSDEWSMAVLVQELCALYGSFSRREPSSLPELKIQYADYAIWQRRWLERGALAEQLDYWKHQLSGASPLRLPADRQPGPIRNYNGAHIPLKFSSDVTRSIKALSLSEGTTLFMTLLAAFYALLYRRTHQEDIVVGTDVANRNYGQTEELIGFFVNMLVLRANLHSDLTFRELLRQVRETALQAYSHQDLPFDELVRHLEKHRDSRANPLFDVVFVLQNTPRQELAFPGLSFQPFRIDSGIVHFDLVLQMNEVGDELVGTLGYRTDMFDQATAARLARDYETVLASTTANPNQCLSELQFLTADESGGLTAADFPKARMSQKEFEDVLAAMSKSASSKTV
jgi:acyl carrier protein